MKTHTTRSITAALAFALGLGLAAEGTASNPAGTDSAAAREPKPGAAAPEQAKKAAKKKAKAAKSGKGSAMGESKTAAGTMPVAPAVAPEHVQVQHILVGFSGSVPGKAIQRTQEEARKLAYELLERARKGEDFGALVARHTDDSPPGIYGMSGRGVAPGPGEYPRDGMVPAFGNVGFAISPGNIGIADYDPKASPFGWHIIKRLK